MTRFLSAQCLLAAALLGLSYCLLMSSAHAADKAGCQNPAWAAARPPGYEIDSCVTEPWVSTEIWVHNAPQHPQGSRSQVHYTLTDRGKNISNAVARHFYVDQAQKAGATNISEPGGSGVAVLTRKGPDGEYWYMWQHGDGGEDVTNSYTLTTIKIGPPPQKVRAREDNQPLDISGGACKDPAWLATPYPGYNLDHCNVREFDRVPLDQYGGSKVIAGRVQEVDYALTGDNQATPPPAVPR